MSHPSTVEPATGPGLSRNISFQLLMGGQLASSLGAAIASIALPLVLLELTGSPSVAGALSSLPLLATLVLGLLGGVIADRWPRRRLMVLTSTLASVAWAAGAALLTTDRFALIGLAGAAVITAIAMAFFQPAQNGAVRHLVPVDQLPQAIAVDEARETVAGLLGAPLGGALLAFGVKISLWSNAIGFLIAALCIAGIPRPLGPDRVSRPHSGMVGTARSVIVDAREGLRHIWRRVSVRICFLAAAVLNIPFVGMQIGLVIALRTVGTSTYLVGLVELASGLGVLTGALLVRPLSQRLAMGAQILITASAIAVSGLLIAVAFPHIALVLPACFMSTLFVPALNGSLIGHVFATAPEEMAGRIGSAAQVASGLLVPIAPALSGVLIDAMGGRNTLLALAGMLGVLALSLALTPQIRQLRTVEDSTA